MTRKGVLLEGYEGQSNPALPEIWRNGLPEDASRLVSMNATYPIHSSLSTFSISLANLPRRVSGQEQREFLKI